MLASTTKPKVETALINAPYRGTELVFGRPLLERMLALCKWVGVRRFFIKVPADQRPSLEAALGSFASTGEVHFVEDFESISTAKDGAALELSGNIVFTRSQIDSLLDLHRAHPDRVVSLKSAGGDTTAEVAIGSLNDLIYRRFGESIRQVGQIEGMPFALDGHPADRSRAELLIARSLRHDSAAKDGFMARVFDRKISWRLSYLLAHTPVTPNQITIANTVLGLLCAVLLGCEGYWLPLVGALLFVFSVTLDGVDGELARLKMMESEAGRRLDVMTDNLVHVAVFFGIAIGAWRIGHDSSYLYLLGLLLGGFGLCAISVNRAMSLAPDEAAQWLGKVDRIAGRDFAYVILGLALLGRTYWFIWGAAVGTYVFAAVLWWMTDRQMRESRAVQGE